MKYLSCPDFHFSMANLTTNQENAGAILRAASERAVGFIALPGDLFTQPIYQSDAGGANELRAIVKSWLAICPVLAVEGTPSHDAPGAYGPLEDAGLTLLRPGLPHYIAGGLVFGVPELRKDTIQAQLGLPAEQANAEAVRLFREYLGETIGPMRLERPDLPAIGLLHGVVTDYHRDDVTDPAIRASDIIIRTEDLALAGLDYWSLGHIHTPWTSSVIRASYAGSWGTNWGETGFQPCVECITVETGAAPVVERIPYGTPRREKIRRPAHATDPAIAYWLESDDPAAGLPQAVHPWSRVTLRKPVKETRRVTAEQAEAATSLWDLFRLADPDVDEALKAKIEAVEQATPAVRHEPIDVRVLSVEIQGCDFFGGETRALDIEALPDGLTAIIGENGAGKSTLLAFCTPYPVVVGKDTESGRPSAIKDFFSGRDSLIRKRLTVNGLTHEHLITIKGAHTQSPKVECYLMIEGESQLEKATWDTMMAACEDLYGPFADYNLTTFYEQPQQARSNQSGLMSASMTDARDIVQNIAGIDRTAEKRHALDRVAECEREIASLSAKIEALDVDTDTQELEESLAWSRGALAAARSDLVNTAADGKKLQTDVEFLAIQKQEADAMTVKLAALERERRETEASITAREGHVSALRHAVEDLESNRETVKDYEARTERIAELEREKAAELERVAEAQKVYSVALECRTAVERVIAGHEREIDSLGGRIDLNEEKARSLEKKCPQCGYVDSEAALRIEALKDACQKLEQQRRDLQIQLEAVALPDAPVAPVASDYDETELTALGLAQTSVDLPATRAAIETGIRAESEIAQAERDIQASKEQLRIINTTDITTDATAAPRHAAAVKSLAALRDRYTTVAADIARTEESVRSKEVEIERIQAQADEVEAMRDLVSSHTLNNEQWAYIAKMLNPDKIPALELDIMLDTIDADATANIAPYYGGRFSIRTETQGSGKKGQVDRFDILVHDSTTGLARSFLRHSPGQKAFFNDSYVKALVRQRNSRGDRSYSPIIADEADGPISPDLVPAFYEMQSAYYDGQDVKVLVVSHAPGAQQFVESHVEVAGPLTLSSTPSMSR